MRLTPREAVSAEELESRVLFSVFTVTNTLDGPLPGPAGSLRRAISNVNLLRGSHTINFDIAPGGVQTIMPAAPFQTILHPVDIDGTTQGGYAGSPLIQISGTQAGVAAGLTIAGGDSSVRGLVVNHFDGPGILLVNKGYNAIQRNYLGTDVNGTVAAPNAVGVRVMTDHTLVGNALPNQGPGNVISGNTGPGVQIMGIAAQNNIVNFNHIGTTAGGKGMLGNGGAGVLITNDAGDNRVGTPGSHFPGGNVIAFNGGDGVDVTSGVGNFVAENSIFRNGGLGIDLRGDGVTPNDPLDADAGPNFLQNFPVITSAVNSALGTTITGSVHSTPSTNLAIHFYYNHSLDPSGHGEGQHYLRSTSADTDAAGNASFTYLVPGGLVTAAPVGSFVTATATSFRESGSSTSEFSAARQVIGLGLAAAPPQVTAVFLSSSRWGIVVREYIGATEAGSPDFGYAAPARGARWPWVSLDEVSVRFSEHVNVAADALSVTGASGRRYAPWNFRYDADSMTATWRLGASADRDRLRFALDAAGVTTPRAGVRLDGEAGGAFPSGNGAAGGDFVFAVDVLAGDSTGDGVVNALDLAGIKRRLGSATADGPGADGYSLFADVNPGGRVNALDLAAVKQRLNRRLPAELRAGTAALSPVVGYLYSFADRDR